MIWVENICLDDTLKGKENGNEKTILVNYSNN